MSNACPSEIPSLAQYLIDCVNGDHAHVKLKALFVIKTLAYRRKLDRLPFGPMMHFLAFNALCELMPGLAMGIAG